MTLISKVTKGQKVTERQQRDHRVPSDNFYQWYGRPSVSSVSVQKHQRDKRLMPINAFNAKQGHLNVNVKGSVSIYK